MALSLPLTLGTLRALVLSAGGQTFALPTVHISTIVRVKPTDLALVEGREMLLGGAAPVPVVALAETLGLAPGRTLWNGGRVALVVVASGDRQAAFAVDELIAEQEVVVKNLGRRLRRVRHFSGATALPSGRLALLLAAAELVETALGLRPTRSLSPAQEVKAAPRARRVLVVDDSLTTRSLEKSILEGAGYEVLTAADGEDAWRLLQERGADAVVADVEMPRMDGFALTEAIRASRRFARLPVVLVTALESERDRQRGLEAGADAYLPKGSFDQRLLLEALARLI